MPSPIPTNTESSPAPAATASATVTNSAASDDPLQALPALPDVSGDVVTEALISLQQMLKQAQSGYRAVKRAEDQTRIDASKKEAAELREKAADIRTGAIISGACLGVSALSHGLAYRASGTPTANSSGETPGSKVWSGLAGSLQGASGVVEKGYEAAGIEHEANSAQARARADLARSRAEDANELAGDTGEAVQKALDAIHAIAESRNAAIMAILSPRA